MAKFAEAMLSVLDTTNTVANVYEDYLEKDAKRSTQNKQIQLKDDINKQMMEIQRSSTSDEWEQKMTDYFQNVKSQMSDKNSPYYCKNNLQAEQFDAVLSQAQVTVSNEVSQLVFKADRTKAIVEYQNTLETLAQTETPENFLKLGNEAARNLRECGFIDEDQLQQQYNTNYDKAYINAATKYFDNTVEEAIRRGDSEQTVIDMVFKNMPELTSIDTAGLPKLRDTTQLKDTLTKTMKQGYRAKQQDIWDQTEKQCAQIYDSIMDQRTAEGRNTQRMAGRILLDSVKDTGLISADQLTKWTARFQLEDYLSPEGTTTKAQAKAAINKLDPKDTMQFFLNSIKRGDESDLGGPATVYNSYELFKGKCMDELLNINPEYTYTELEQSCPTVMEYLEYAKKNLPPMMQDVVEAAKNMLTTCLGDTGAKEEMNSVMDIVYDMLFETNISDFDAAQQKVYKDRIARAINSKYGSKLEKDKNFKWLKDETGIEAITDYKKGVFGQEKALAQALQARDNNPDIYYKDMYGNDKFWMGEDVQKGLTLIENEERQMLADAIKYKTGKDINPASILSQYENDGVNDKNARNIYTINGNDYYFASKDGKHVTMYEKKTGIDPKTKEAYEWKEVKTAAQQEKYDSPRETAKRAVQDIDVSTVPPFKVPASGMMPEVKYSQKEWDDMNNVQKKNIIMSLLNKYPEEMQQWLDAQPNKKKK